VNLRRVAAFAAVTLGLALIPFQADASPAVTGWSGTWGTAQAAAVNGVTTGYPGTTIRNVVHSSTGGSRVRVHLSNRFGTAPVLFGHVTVAVSANAGGKADGTVQRSTGDARPGTMRELSFAGRRAVTVPTGAEVISDPVAVAVPADHDLLVTTWTPNPSGTVTYHPAAMQDSFFNRDNVDHSADPTAASFPQTTQVWHYVSGVDVAGGPGTIVALGDSITDGVTSTWGANRRWPDHLGQRLRANTQVPDYGIVNAGISGNRILLDSNYPHYDIFQGSGRNALSRLSYDVLDRPGARTMIVLLGINDIQQTPHQSDPEAIIAGLSQLVTQAEARGLRTVGATIMPWEGWGSYNQELENTRLAVNKWIRTGGAFDAVADMDAATRDPANPHRMLAAYDSGDHLHPNDAGDRAMAASVPLGKL
jgi:lysophospholipase L1-like esterase